MNNCSRCGTPIAPGTQHCSRCGNYVGNPQMNNAYSNNTYNANYPYGNMNYPNNTYNNPNYQNNPNYYNVNPNNYGVNSAPVKDNRYKMLGLGLGVGVVLIVFAYFLFFRDNSNDYYFNTSSQDDTEEIITSNNNSSKTTSKYRTVIVYDHSYTSVTINNETDAKNLIVKDSVEQKGQCPSDIKKVEEELIKNYNITAVNLCEMDVNFARELGNVFKKVYAEFPGVRRSITNVTLVNGTMSDNYIAAFMPSFSFAISNSTSGYPHVIKTQILLNTSYFLNKERLAASVKDGSNSGHFPPNATIYSPVAHELGHYLSFLALSKYHQNNGFLVLNSSGLNSYYDVMQDFASGDYSLSMIKEAYNKYQKDTKTTLSLDEWRGTISQYALAKDNSGKYIYDETIAEAFHDVYLNGTKAKDASKYIVNVLKEKLG